MTNVRHTIKHVHLGPDPMHTSTQQQVIGIGYWCGRVGDNNEWCFHDAQHLALSAGGSIQPCKNCVKAIIKELNKEL